jgi:hypothetical protein
MAGVTVTPCRTIEIRIVKPTVLQSRSGASKEPWFIP